MEKREKFQELVNRFELNKGGANPFDPELLDANSAGASHGELVSIAFLLNVWSPGHRWQVGDFDAMDALGVWDASKRAAFCEWAQNPWWP